MPAIPPVTVVPAATVTLMAPLLALGVAYQARMPSPRETMEPAFMVTRMFPSLWRACSAFTLLQ